jgi:hypothetical protein
VAYGIMIINYLTGAIRGMYDELMSPDDMLNSSIEHYPDKPELESLLSGEDLLGEN